MNTRRRFLTLTTMWMTVRTINCRKEIFCVAYEHRQIADIFASALRECRSALNVWG